MPALQFVVFHFTPTFYEKTATGYQAWKERTTVARSEAMLRRKVKSGEEGGKIKLQLSGDFTEILERLQTHLLHFISYDVGMLMSLYSG